MILNLRISRNGPTLNLRSLTLAACLFFVTALAVAQQPAAGYLRTDGALILDSASNPVRLASINWYGFETTQQVPGGLDVQDYHTILATIKSNGYNTIRLPFSNQMVENPAIPGIGYYAASGPINTDLAGLTSLQILDRIVAAAGTLGLRIILDNHRSEAGSSAEANGLWYTAQYPESSWIYDWTFLAQRYLNNPTVIGMDLRNELHSVGTGGSCWGCGSLANDWSLAASRGGNAILAINPKLLIFVEGVDCFAGDCTWWGGNLEGVNPYPVTLNLPNRLVYSPHEYGPNLFRQGWFNGATSPASLQALWYRRWGYLYVRSETPIWVGEFGTTNTASDIDSTVPGSQGQWFQAFTSYLAANPNISWSYWALNGSDTYGLLDSNYSAAPASPLKQQVLASIQAPAPVAPGFGISASASALHVTQGGSAFDTIAVAGVGGFASNVVFYAVRVSSGVTLSFAPNFTKTTTLLTISAATSAPPGTYTTTIVGHTNSLYSETPITITIAPPATPSFTLSPSSSALPIAPGKSAVDTVTVTSAGGFTGSVTLAVSGLPPGVTAAIAANPVSTFATLAFTASISAAPGTYPITVTGTSGTLSASTTLTLTVPAPVASGFACHVAYTISNQYPGGFQAALSLSNTGTSAISSWTLTWNFANGQTITQLWNGTEAQTGPAVTVTSESYNGTIPAGSSYTASGFTGTWNNATNAIPTSFSINGTVCH